MKGHAADESVVCSFNVCTARRVRRMAVYRDGIWYLLQSTNGFTEFHFGQANDIPAPADYDGDGKTDAAIYRNGQWWLMQSTSGVAVQQFGLANDKPVPSVYLP
ncbi:MAG: hypothetical protein ACT4O9_17450 [Blastocatellia bacterium]